MGWQGGKGGNDRVAGCSTASLDFQPNSEGTWRRVTPEDFYFSLQCIEEIVGLEDSPTLKILHIGMEDDFFVTVKCCYAIDYLLSKVKSDPQTIIYDSQFSRLATIKTI